MPSAQILEGNANLVNLLRVPGEQQVMLMVTVAEVNRTAARTIGMDFSITKGGLAFAQNTGQGLNIGTAAAGTVTGVTGISPAAQALRDVGGNLPTADRQRQCPYGDPGAANLELRAEPGGTQPHHSQW